MKRIFFVGIICFSLIVTISPVKAGIIYEQLPGPNSGVVYNSTPDVGYRAADDFVFNTNKMITDIHWWGLTHEGVDGNDFAFTFYDDAAGTPGNIIHTTSGSLSTEVYDTGSAWEAAGYEVLMYSSFIDTPFNAQAGTIYWLSIFNQFDPTGATSRWGWQIANTRTYGAPVRSQPYPSGGDWVFTDNDDLAFRLTDDAAPIPEPTTMLLLGTGLVGVAGAARRKKKNQA